VLWAVRWYCRYAVSYRDLESMVTERGVAVDHSTIYRWVQRYAPPTRGWTRESASPIRPARCFRRPTLRLNCCIWTPPALARAILTERSRGSAAPS